MIAFIERLSVLAGALAAALIAVAIVIVCQMVFLRYVLVWSTAWQTEVVTFSVVAAVMLGSAWVLKERGHVSVELVTANAPPGARRIMAMLSDAVVFAFAAFMFWKGGTVTWHAFHGGWTTESIYEFPLWIPYVSMPIGFGLLALQSLACFLKVMRGEELAEMRGH